jgi:tagaturonate reductase
MGLETVKSCVDDEIIGAHLRACIYDEIIPTLDLPKEELISYANDVIERFSNPYIKHYLSAISLNSVSKFKVRVLPSILEYIKKYYEAPKTLMLSFGKLIEFYRTDMPKDDPAVMKFMKTASLNEILENKELWGQDLSALAEELK